MYDTFLVSTYHHTGIEEIKEKLLDLAAVTMDDPLGLEESDHDHKTQVEIAIAFTDRIRFFLVNGEWPTDDYDAKAIAQGAGVVAQG